MRRLATAPHHITMTSSAQTSGSPKPAMIINTVLVVANHVVKTSTATRTG